MTLRPVAFVAVLLTATTASAQSTTSSTLHTVQDIVTFLVTNQGVATSDFDKDRAAADATRVTLSNALLASISTVPISSSSSGFNYRTWLDDSGGLTSAGSQVEADIRAVILAD